MASRLITRVHARAPGSTLRIQEGGTDRNFITGNITTEDVFTAGNRVVFPDFDPFTDFEEIQFIAQFGTGDEEAVFSYFNSQFNLYPFDSLTQEQAFEIRPNLGRGDSIMVSMSPTTDDIYIRSGSALVEGGAGVPPRSSQSIDGFRSPPVRLGDPGTIEGILPFGWYADDPFAGVYAQASRDFRAGGLGLPFRYNTYFSVDECNRLLLNNPRLDRNIWPIPKQIANNRFEPDTPEQLARKSALILRATNFMDVAHEWRGYQTRNYQSLEFPRFNLLDRSGYSYDQNIIPAKIKQSYADFAYELAVEDRLLTATDEPGSVNLNSVAAGSVSVSFNSMDRKVIVPKYIEIQIGEFVNRYFASNPVALNLPI